MSKVLEKVERRLGEKLFIKGERCVGPKCALVRRAYPPGVHGKAKSRRRGSSEYGSLLRQKQKIRFLYGLDDKDVKNYSKEAILKKGIFGSNLVELLERRLDNVVFRLGFAESRHAARQMVSHGHVSVSGKTVDIPSYRVRPKEIVALKERFLKSPLASGLENRLKKIQVPKWLKLDSAKKAGEVAGKPESEEAGLNIDLIKIKEFYSR